MIFSFQSRKITTRYRRIGYNLLNVMRQSACLVAGGGGGGMGGTCSQPKFSKRNFTVLTNFGIIQEPDQLLFRRIVFFFFCFFLFPLYLLIMIFYRHFNSKSTFSFQYKYIFSHQALFEIRRTCSFGDVRDVIFILVIL